MFFDLNIPFLELATNGETKNKTLKSLRHRSVARAMELGYSGVAYDRPFRGVMSDSDRCRIPHLSLESLVEASRSLIPSASFHRDLLGASKSSPFRQYTRVTVAVDRFSVGTAFNAKSVLRSYDLVAARPADQEGFNQACQVSEVDIIALDFPLRFRLKLPMVQAAIKRGVHFEISYSNLISNDHRNKMLSDARLLVDWTRGKNIILSSSASSVNDIRGPCDVVNLASFLLGLSTKQAKAAISANCRSLLGNALRKKDYKEAIRIERIPEKQLDSKGTWFQEWNDWDPISSGERDLPPLDDESKLLSVPSKLSKSFNAIDFRSCDNSFSFKDQISCIREDLPPMSNSKPVSAAVMEVPLANAGETAQREELQKILVGDAISVDPIPLELQISDCRSGRTSPSGMLRLSADSEEVSIAVNSDGNPQNLARNTVLSNAARVQSYDTQLKHCTFEHERNLPSVTDPKQVAAVINFEQPTVFMEDLENSDCPDIVSNVVEIPKVVTESVDCMSSIVADHLSSGNCTFSSAPLDENAPKLQITETLFEREHKDEELNSGIPMDIEFVRPSPSKEEESGPVPDDGALNDDETKEREQRVELWSAAGKGRRKAKTLSPAYPLPFKSLLKPMLFKKRVSKSRKLCRPRRSCNHL
ncbi:uncharacterized protein M6B38_364475 [Iris pallida]|uniref:Uncharacterized protein n=1 Tax=Iris pallida TaxID=29817 RepID=A0AAX6GID8_IRIPA|nr:uncharacterized protein M6B38_364475 [Iris pallida]